MLFISVIRSYIVQEGRPFVGICVECRLYYVITEDGERLGGRWLYKRGIFIRKCIGVLPGQEKWP